MPPSPSPTAHLPPGEGESNNCFSMASLAMTDLNSNNSAPKQGSSRHNSVVTIDMGSSPAKDKDKNGDGKSIIVPRPKLSLWELYGGIVMALCASAFFSSSFILIKFLEPKGLHAFGAALTLNLGIILPCSLAILFNEFGPGWRNRRRVLHGIWPISKDTVLGFMTIQGLLQATSVVLRAVSLKTLSVGDMTVIVFSSPIVTTILAHFIVGEKIGIVFILIAISTLCGVGLVVKPPIITGAKSFDHGILVGSCFALGAMIALSLKFVVTRKIKETHFLAMTFFLGLMGVGVSLPLFLIFESPSSLIPSDTHGLLLRLGFLMGFGAIACVNLALQKEDAGVVALVRSCDVIFAFGLQYVFLGVVPDMYSGIGAAMVWTGVLVAGIQKFLYEKKQRRKSKKAVVAAMTEKESKPFNGVDNPVFSLPLPEKA